MERIIQEMLKKKDAVETLTENTNEKLGKTQFEIDCEGAITLEELREGLYKKIDGLWQK